MSMSDMKYDAVVARGIAVVERVLVPAGFVPPDASVEIEAKKAADCCTLEGRPDEAALRETVGRSLQRT